MLNVAAASSRTKNSNEDHRKREEHDAKLAVRAQSSSAMPQTSNILLMHQKRNKSTRSFKVKKPERESSGLELLNAHSTPLSEQAQKLAVMREEPLEDDDEAKSWLGIGLADDEQAMITDDGMWLAAYDQQHRGEQEEAGADKDIHSIAGGSFGTLRDVGSPMSASGHATSHHSSHGQSSAGTDSGTGTLVGSGDKRSPTSPKYDHEEKNLNTRQEHSSAYEIVSIAVLAVTRFTIYPHWAGFRAWELGVVALVVFNGIMLPFELAFWTTTGAPKAVQQINSGSDVIFWIDLVQNFFVAHIDSWGTLHTSKKTIARAYLSSWFLIDFIACVPFELFVPGYLVSASDLLKCVRLLRLAKILRFLDRLQFGTATRIVRLFLTVLLLCHWVACLWYRLGTMVLERGECDLASFESEPGRVSPLHKLRFCSWLIGHGEYKGTNALVSMYLRSLYWSIATIMTVGYGDIVPVNLVEHLLYIFVTIVGAGVYAHVFSTIVRVFDRANALNNEFASVMEDAQSQMSYLRFPAALREKIFSYYSNVFEKQKYMLSGQGPFYKSLPAPLASACAESLFFTRLEEVPFLQDCTTPFLLGICSALNRMICVPAQAVVRQGEASDAWFIIESGTLTVEQKDRRGDDKVASPQSARGSKPKTSKRRSSQQQRETGSPKNGEQATPASAKAAEPAVRLLRVLGKGDHFGEIGLLTGTFRTATVRATTFCELNYITVARFYTLLGRYQVDNKQILHNCVAMLRQSRTAGAKSSYNNLNSGIWLQAPKHSQAARDETSSSQQQQEQQQQQHSRDPFLLPNSIETRDQPGSS